MMISRSSTPIVKDLKPEDLVAKEQPRPRTALEIARDRCAKIGNSKPGDLFSALPDDPVSST